jgi:hypothetical protein
VVLPSVRILSEEGRVASEQGLAAVRVDFVGSGNDPLIGKENGTQATPMPVSSLCNRIFGAG